MRAFCQPTVTVTHDRNLTDSRSQMAVALHNLQFLLKSVKFVRISHVRTIMASQINREKVLEDLKSNAYFDKYADKIAKLQQTSPEEFLSRVDSLESTKAPPSAPPRKRQENVTEGKYAQLLNPKKPLEQPKDVAETTLDSIMKIDLIRDKTPEEIKEIWLKYHSDKNCIAAVIPSGDYAQICENARKFPTFIFALPRNQGYEFFLSQFERNRVHLTPLLYYQVHKENAPECLSMTHFSDLESENKIVLMRGEFDDKIIDFKEAQCLANQLQLYYVRPSETKAKIMETFTKKPDEFKHMDIIKEIESLTL